MTVSNVHTASHDVSSSAPGVVVRPTSVAPSEMDAGHRTTVPSMSSNGITCLDIWSSLKSAPGVPEEDTFSADAGGARRGVHSCKIAAELGLSVDGGTRKSVRNAWLPTVVSIRSAASDCEPVFELRETRCTRRSGSGVRSPSREQHALSIVSAFFYPSGIAVFRVCYSACSVGERGTTSNRAIFPDKRRHVQAPENFGRNGRSQPCLSDLHTRIASRMAPVPARKF